MPVPVSQTLTLTSTLVPKEESNMPFIDDELLWCPDNDGKMVDLTQCLQESSTGQSVEFSAMELSALVGTPAAPNVPAEEGEGMSNVTGEEPFDTLDTFLRELQADLAEASQPSSTTTPLTNSCRRQRYNIAAANPLLAEKLAAPSSQASPTTIPYATRAEIKTENIQHETSKVECSTFERSYGSSREGTGGVLVFVVVLMVVVVVVVVRWIEERRWDTCTVTQQFRVKCYVSESVMPMWAEANLKVFLVLPSIKLLSNNPKGIKNKEHVQEEVTPEYGSVSGNSSNDSVYRSLVIPRFYNK
ncbi:hypothetical protein M0802_002096 [Mischocyttarus mexicanus]|nr:hypothetical protein M0802_002096 [Mischocyttarus mexicanus]